MTIKASCIDYRPIHFGLDELERGVSYRDVRRGDVVVMVANTTGFRIREDGELRLFTPAQLSKDHNGPFVKLPEGAQITLTQGA